MKEKEREEGRRIGPVTGQKEKKKERGWEGKNRPGWEIKNGNKKEKKEKEGKEKKRKGDFDCPKNKIN